MKRGALLSVSDKRGLKEFASALIGLDFELFSSSGTRQFLLDNGIPCTAIDDYTGQAEILDGRVKTLHPRIHAGILAKRDNAAHMQELDRSGITPLDVVVVNLYPFVKKVETELRSDPDAMVEYIDVGGPAMIRAAAKNHAGVFAVIDPDDYPRVAEVLRESLQGRSDLAMLQQFRRTLAAKVFAWLAADNLEAARYYSSFERGSEGESRYQGMVLQRSQSLRYGENPHQSAAFFTPLGMTSAGAFRQLNGKELSYNNLLDFDATRRMTNALRQRFPGKACAVIVKHLNPCGAAVANSLAEALQMAKRGDPRSHFGGIIGFSAEVDEKSAAMVREDFAEIVLAPAYTPQAIEILRASKNLRVLETPLRDVATQELRSCADGYLLQQPDVQISALDDAEAVTKRPLSEQERRDLEVAWTMCAHVKSNAIVIARNDMLIGVGAGQMSRIDSAELALSRARMHGHSTQGAVAASDAFFPFPDTVELLAGAGVSAVIAPRGAKRDEEVVALAAAKGLTLLFTGDRHFRH